MSCKSQPAIWNSDQGSQFTRPRYTQRLRDAGVKISKASPASSGMTGRGRALDNIFTERLWRTVKYEEVYLKDYVSPKEAGLSLHQYLTFNNQERWHQALDYQTPAEIHTW